MENCKRFRKRWTIKECLDLQREFELLKMSIDDIALKHQRTPNAIMLKLDEQGFADYNVLYSNYHGLNSPMGVIRKHTYDEFDDNIVNNFIDDLEPESTEELSEESSQEEQEEQEEEKDDDINKRMDLLESHVATLTELVLKLSNNNNNTKKSVFSLFS
jgi:hypothetical protein